ncbi:cryptochrome-1 [Iris pallida]|uniref:Cryptochrome-1 n=1 Tax=Iris pallida TaxID=29817 RepID=A0AAX6EZW7_IRIPA|nr:cryptochrome-1 [Iris pallida]
MNLPIEPTSLLLPWKLVPPKGTENVQIHSIEELCLENDSEKSSNALLGRGWSPGWSNADKVLTEFIEDNLIDYSKKRMKVEGTTTSFLSPYLHFGEISVRKIYQSVRLKQMHGQKKGTPAQKRVPVSFSDPSVFVNIHAIYVSIFLSRMKGRCLAT